MQAAQHELKVKDLARLHHDLGRFYAHCYQKLAPAFHKANLIGLHGQTVYHEAPRATLQIGESSYLSSVSKKIVVSDFRSADLSLGGQGAPIATLFSRENSCCRQEFKNSVSIHNLGGISNLSLISSAGVQLSFDTGPANMLVDLYLQLSLTAKSFLIAMAQWPLWANQMFSYSKKCSVIRIFEKRLLKVVVGKSSAKLF